MLEQTTREKVIAALETRPRPGIYALMKELGVSQNDVWCLYQLVERKKNPDYGANSKTNSVLYRLRQHPDYSNPRIARMAGCTASHVNNTRDLLKYLRDDPVTAPHYGPIKGCKPAAKPAVAKAAPEAPKVETQPEAPKLTGGSSDYYKVVVAHPTSGDDPYTAECNDIIEALDMTFAEGNIMKALWRRAADRSGNGKPGTTSVYDAEKIVFFAQRLLAQSK